MVARVLAELLVDQPQVPAERADGGCAHAADFRVLLHDAEQLEDRRRVAREDVVRGHLEVVVAHLEARVERDDRRFAVAEDGLAEQLQQHLVQQAHVHDRAVVALHELLDGEGVRGVLVAEHLRQPDLVVEQQPVLAPARDHVQPEARLPQEGLRRAQLAQLGGRQEAVVHQLVEGLGAEVALRHPADGLDVAQAAGARLDVGFEVVRGVVVTMVARLLLGHLGLEERLRGPDVVLREGAAHRLEEEVRAREQPRLDQRGRDADVRRALALAVVDGAHAVADLEADVPQEGEEPLDALVAVAERRLAAAGSARRCRSRGAVRRGRTRPPR